MNDTHIAVTLKEDRIFPPNREFSDLASIKARKLGGNYEDLVALGQDKPEKYWADAASELHWFQPWKTVLEWDAPWAKWFGGGKLNASFNCLDRHLAEKSSKVAILWEGETGEVIRYTYAELHAEVEKFKAALVRLGLKPGDCVAIYLPLIPQAAVAMLACARGGFPHTVVFAGFSRESLKDRIQDAGAKAVITADGGFRKGAVVSLKDQVIGALTDCPDVAHVIEIKRDSLVSRNAAEPSDFARGKSHNYWALLNAVTTDDVKNHGQAEALESEHPLFILYTSGTTGKPKGILHTTAGYLTGAQRSTQMVFDLNKDDLYWCTADVGWITGHTYLVYGPLACGASIFMYEGAPTHPKPDRFWEMIARHKISILYTAPTAIRTFMKMGDQHVKAHDLSSLRLLGSVGEPINPEAWMWYRDTVGGGRCPIVDTFWQTETGSIVISPIPGVTSTKPGSATLPLPGFAVDVVDKHGNSVPLGGGGFLVIRKPWPSLARTIHKDPERFKKAYFGEFGGDVYFTGDGARRDEDGYIWCLGRVDDVLNVSGHRLGTMEIESALVSHPRVAEAAVVGRPDEVKGQAISAFVSLKMTQSGQIKPTAAELETLKKELKAHVANEIGALARPDDIRFTDNLPKTRSGKIMRRLLRELAANGEVKGDTSTLEDFSVVASLQKDED